MTFKAGESGNPSGRPPGIIDKRTKLRGLLDQHAETIVAKLIEHATAGESTALKLCIERLIPRVKPDSGICFALPEGRLDAPETKLQIIDGIIQSVSSGQMTIEEANRFNNFLDSQRRRIGDAERDLQYAIEREERRKLWEEKQNSKNLEGA